MAVEKPSQRRTASAPGDGLLARKGRASARGFATAAAVDAVAAEVARTARPRTTIELGRPGPTATDRARQRLRALIADGDALSRKLYRDLLEADGYDVVVTADGIAALDAVRHGAPDIAIVNLRLAGLSGLAGARRIGGADGRGAIPIGAGAERSRPGDEAAARAGGCAAYLAKPISARALLDTIDRLMHPAGRPGSA